MLSGLWSASTGMRAQQNKIDVIANNIANINTTGFRKKTVVFKDLMYREIEGKGSAVQPAGTGEAKSSTGSGSYVAAIKTNFSSGNMMQTGAVFDFALNGEGYFQVMLPDGREAYTRDGNFRLDGNGALVTTRGFHVSFPELPEGNFEMSLLDDGTITITADDSDPVEAGRLELVRFSNPLGLEQLGDNLFVATEASGLPEHFLPGKGTVVLQGYLESSNVELSEEMVQLLLSQRAFELNSRSLRTSDEMWSLANQIRR